MLLTTSAWPCLQKQHSRNLGPALRMIFANILLFLTWNATTATTIVKMRLLVALLKVGLKLDDDDVISSSSTSSSCFHLIFVQILRRLRFAPPHGLFTNSTIVTMSNDCGPSLPYGRDYDYCYCCRNDDPAASSPPSHLPSLLCHRCTSRPIGDHILSPCNPDSLSLALLSLCTLRMRGAQLSDTVGLCFGRSLARSLSVHCSGSRTHSLAHSSCIVFILYRRP